MKCIRCSNTDANYFYNDNGIYYCRKCVSFGRINVGDKIKTISYKVKQHSCQYHLDFVLTTYQKKAIHKVNVHLKKGQNVLVYAATGAGKTEIVMQSIQNYLNAKKKVGMAISRRQVVVEIRERLAEAFKGLTVIAVCEGYTKVIDADIIVCTMHQLYRYHQTFDLLIMDEVDAFPYYRNDVLNQIAMHASKGEIIYLTATPDEEMLENIKKGKLKVVELFQRPHGYPLVEPSIIKAPLFVQYLYLYYFLSKNRKQKKQVIVFVPTIHMANSISMYLRVFFKTIAFTSKTKDRDEIITSFRKKQYDFLIATTILERGITIKGVNVIVVNADHMVFNEASLIQIIGRVGRSMDSPTGTGVLLCSKQNHAIKMCKQSISKMNSHYD